MQDYIALRIEPKPCDENITDLLAAFLCDVGYESFTSDDSGIIAYIKAESYSESDVKDILSDFPIQCEFLFNIELVKGDDWNEEWEKNYFQPIIVDDRCVVHSSFHKEIPVAEYDIVIDPKMAFGTGHHSTTSNMMRHILRSDLKGKDVIDMGTGTGILAILCKMRGAANVTGIEIDSFAWENAIENAKLNKVEISMICGDASKLEHIDMADYFLANINRNVITHDIDKYASRLKNGGVMFLSGFYENDIPIIEKAAYSNGMRLVCKLEDKGWVALKFVKNI